MMMFSILGRMFTYCSRTKFAVPAKRKRPSGTSWLREILTLIIGSGLIVSLLPVVAQSPVQTKKKRLNSADVVEIRATAGKVDAVGRQRITIELAVKDGWYIYANPVANPDLDTNATRVTVVGKNKPAAVKTRYPEGKWTSLGGEKYKIYQGKVTLITEVQRIAADKEPLFVNIRVNSCHKKRLLCLPPGEKRLRVPASVK